MMYAVGIAGLDDADLDGANSRRAASTVITIAHTIKTGLSNRSSTALNWRPDPIRPP